jgi:hypothetical protein
MLTAAYGPSRHFAAA